jgi:DNA-binding response OmpR family regulator
MRLLLIEDDEFIASSLKRGLEKERYLVDMADNGAKGLDLALANAYAVIVLDIMLPGLDGWKLCEALRTERVLTPILMLTARDSIRDRVRGLELGADDYLSKPFDFAELLARIRALQRRDKVHKRRHLQIGHLEIDTAARRVLCAGREVALAPQEYLLLEALALNEGRVLSRDLIQTAVWGNDDSYSNIVDVHIGILRKKIDAGQSVKLIHTVNKLGYLLKRPDGTERERNE